MEQLRSRSKAQASFEFVVVLSIALLLITAFTISISDEYSDTFILSAVRNTIQSEASKLVLQTPGCANTALKEMSFSKDTGTITFSMIGCKIEISKVTNIVGTTLCGMNEPTNTGTFICSGTVYTLVEI